MLSDHNQHWSVTPLLHCFVSAPTTPSASPSPEKAAAVSPAAPTEPRIAPGPVTPPKGNSSSSDSAVVPGVRYDLPVLMAALQTLCYCRV